MGIAILSGVVESLDVGSRPTNGSNKWESHTPGTMTPVAPDPSVPSRFIACVSREQSAKTLQTTFGSLGTLGRSIEVRASENLKSVQQSDVVILWWAIYTDSVPSTNGRAAVNPSLLLPSFRSQVSRKR